jgi:hypothetical protein
MQEVVIALFVADDVYQLSKVRRWEDIPVQWADECRWADPNVFIEFTSQLL